jgi:hypothetical protein
MLDAKAQGESVLAMAAPFAPPGLFPFSANRFRGQLAPVKTDDWG